MKETEFCGVCHHEKEDLKGYDFGHRHIDICPECVKRISEGKDEEFEDIFQALVKIGEFV